LELVPGKLYGLGARAEVEGRTSWVAPQTSGRQRQNALLLLEGDEALLVDCGPASVSPEVVEQLDQLLPPSRELSIVLSRSEFETTGGVAAIARAFRVKAVYAAGQSNPFDGFQMAAAPASGGRRATGGPKLVDVQLKRLAATDSVPMSSDRELQVQVAPLRMLACSWFYDTGTKTLFPSDFFGYTVDTPDISLEDAYRNLVARYWWLPGARTEHLLDAFDRVFDAYEIEIVAPTHGCVFQGDAVLRERQRVRDMLAHAATQPPMTD
jgi:flavorubredoxin